jgi:hypothetical protein
MKNHIKIYYLHKGDDIPVYIGITKNELYQRLSNHRTKKNTPEYSIELIDEVPEHEWRFWEEFYILLFKSWGFVLENKNNGGCGPRYVNKNTKTKISKALKNKPKPEGFGEMLSSKTKNQKRSKEFSQLQRDIHLGLKRTDKFKQHMSKVMIEKEWKPSPHQIKQIKKHNSIPVLLFNIDGTFIKEYSSQTECAKDIGVSKNQVNNVLKGWGKTCGGYKVKYKNLEKQ